MKKIRIPIRKIIYFIVSSLMCGVILFLAACSPPVIQSDEVTASTPVDIPEEVQPTTLPTRRLYDPGELVDYVAQSGDTLPALVNRFNTTAEEILAANPDIPDSVTTLPPGFPMRIPIYYEPLWGSQFQIIPDSLFVYGPQQVGFDVVQFVDASPGWFKSFSAFAGGAERTGGALVEHLALNFSISPRLILAILEFQLGALTRITPPDPANDFPLGLVDYEHQGLYAQMVLVANMLNNAYYGWRLGTLDSIDHRDGRIEIPDPWQNAATVSLHNYFAQVYDKEDFEYATLGNGLIYTYTQQFGDPWVDVQPHIPGSLSQPALRFPFQPGTTWAYTGGPHTGWGEGEPFAAIDFAPPSVVGGCEPSDEWVTAAADGTIVRASPAVAVLDLDGDGYEQTGWVIFYLHIATMDKVKTGMRLKAGDLMGHPSCEGGRSTGTHIHIARKYNGEWIVADSPLPFTLDGWVVKNGVSPYQGTLEKFGRVIHACVCSDVTSQVTAEEK